MSAAPPLWLFVSYGGGHVRTLLPVACRVRERGIARPLYLALTTAAGPARAAGLDVVGFRDFVGPDDGAALRRGEALARDLAFLAADHDESVAYLGLSYADLEERSGPEGAAAEFGRFGRQAFLPLGPVRRILERLQPALVVATNSPRAERAAIEMARALDIPSACVVDLLGLWERELLARPDYADAVCVLNEGVRRSLLQAGRSPAQVHVTGNPAFDGICDPQLVAEGAALRNAAGWDGLHVCLYASSPEPPRIPNVPGVGDPDLPRAIERELRATVQADPRLALWVRRHPSEEPADAVTAPVHPRIRVSAQDMPLHACIHASDEVLVTVSTVGVEADLAGKRVTQVRGSILDHLSPYLALGIADRELGLEELGGAWSGALQPRTPEPSPGHMPAATDRVVHVLQRLYEGRHG